MTAPDHAPRASGVRAWMIFLAGCVVALAFAAYTNHVWEDYYITYRSSRNLATGHGLVFNVGDRLHTFTSPLGVLLPAVSLLATGNSSDTAALWIFRAISAAAFGGALVLLFKLSRNLAYPALAAGLLVVAMLFDVKSVDFTINGMETAFMLLFLAYALWAQFAAVDRRSWHLGAAWAGLMWTRPDSFIYIGLLAGAAWLFNDSTRSGLNRPGWLRCYLGAALVGAALYLPWFLWAWWYYGSPIPHTIVAKSAQGGADALPKLLHGFWQMPWLIWQGQTAADSAFMPAYHIFPTWPAWTAPWSRTLATLASIAWLFPKQRPETRVASLAFFGSQCYLSFVPYFPFPWYLPATTLLGWMAIAGVVARLAETLGSSVAMRWTLRTFAAVCVAGVLALLCLAGRQLKAQQEYIETGNRRRIGEWLHEHAKPGETVFMEPLGYIGYFSGLKTYDWPGMSSREMVDAIHLIGKDWSHLFLYLQPDWLVMRPGGEGDLPAIAKGWHDMGYEFVREFSRLDEVRKLDVAGRRYLEFDASFKLYHRKIALRQDAEGVQIASPIGSSVRTIGDTGVRMVHAPGIMVVPVPAGKKSVDGWFGFPPEAYSKPTHTDGAEFTVWWSDGTERRLLFARTLRPFEEVDERHLFQYQFDLPPLRPGRTGRLVLETNPHGSMSYDWTCWTQPTFH